MEVYKSTIKQYSVLPIYAALAQMLCLQNYVHCT